jgi:adenine-specific DNA-methyltransferase
MPTLNWIGKDKVINHHMDVPYKILEHQYGFDNGEQSTSETSSGNKIIHGDNLEALKALLPEYEGKINCIYIDPPYNTGNEGWVYNDNVNDPKMRKWLEKTVGKEGEDLSRHDKWLCMMYPRLKLLHKLLAKDGAIFISIDDNEQANLRLLCDEIFGGNNFVSNIVWQKRTSPDSRLNLGAAHDFIICYSKTYVTSRQQFKLIAPSETRSKAYKNIDNDKRGPWASVDLTGQIGHATDSQFYKIKSPSGKIHVAPKDRCWAFAEETVTRLINENRIWFGKEGNSKPRLKKFLSEIDGVSTWTWWSNAEVGHNQEATKELKLIFPEDAYFETPKPSRLLDRILRLSTDRDSIILDSFAGSGTTAHAALNLNKQDGGKRKFILIEMEDYADNITAERVKRVIKGYGEDKKAVEGTGGSFNYYELGMPLFLDNDILNEEVGLEKIREYVWFSETRKPYKKVNEQEEHLLGVSNSSAYYFYYFKDELTTLDDSFLRTLKTKAEQYIIYADNCILDNSLMQKYHITFKKIPRDITRF